MEFIDFTAGSDDSERRLDRILKRLFDRKNCSVNVFQALRKNLIKLNHKKTKAESHVKAGDVISVAAFLLNKETCENAEKTDETENSLISSEQLISVFRNDHLWIINKAAGENVQPVKKYDKNCVSWKVLEDWKTTGKQKNSLAFTPSPLHRLDNKTSGLLCISQSIEGARYFSENIQSHKIKKTYLGIVQGCLTKEEDWEDLIADSKEETKISQFHTSTIDSENGKTAITRAVPLQHGKYKNKDVTLVQFNIKTGRKHQIRLQSSSHGFPLLGDISYGAIKGPFFLHAWKLFFPEDNPLGLPAEIESPLPEDFENFIKTFLEKSVM